MTDWPTTNWIDQPLADIAAAFRDGRLQATDLADDAIARHDRWDDRLKAYKRWDPDLIRKQASAAAQAFAVGADLGPLQGVPVSVKDIFGVDGYPTFAGSPRALPAVYEADGPLVDEVRNQLGVFSGKTHTVEFAYGGLGTNIHWGAPWNPWDADTHRIPGGSSAGAGVSLIEGSALMAFGTDTGGSVRIPASVTGTVGLKTSKDRWPTEGIVPLSTTYDTPGILTRTVADAAYGFWSLDPLCDTRPEAADLRGVRIGITGDYFWNNVQDDIAECVQTAIAELEKAGATLVSVSLAEAQAAIDKLSMGAVVAAEGYAHLTKELPGWFDSLQPAVKTRMALGNQVSAIEYLTARRDLARLAASAQQSLETVDVLAVPTVPITPTPVADVNDDLETYKSRNLATLSNTTVINQMELCALTMPVGLDKAGMPVGLQLVARPWTEERLLSVGIAAENVLGTRAQRLGTPPLGG